MLIVKLCEPCHFSLMQLRFRLILMALLGVFCASTLLAQDNLETMPSDLTSQEQEILKNSQEIDNNIVQSIENDVFTPAPDSDILPAPETVEFADENKGIAELADGGEKLPTFNNSQNYDNPEDRKAIIETIHRKREIDPKKRADLVELSRLFGALHALRIACHGPSDQTYRSKMTSMLDMEAPANSFIREPLIVAFNFGFQQNGAGNGECATDKNAAKEAVLAKLGRNTALKMMAFYSGHLPTSKKN